MNNIAMILDEVLFSLYRLSQFQSFEYLKMTPQDYCPASGTAYKASDCYGGL
jgi:hypothetical protein